MKVDKESVRRVLALFDEEDIPYIKSSNLLKVINGEEYQPSETDKKVKVKKIGEVNDRFRK